MTAPPRRDAPAHAAIIWTLCQAGFSRGDAEQWAHGWACRKDPLTVLAQAEAFDDHGAFTVDQAVEWHQAGFAMPEAGWWRDARYRPSQANEVLRLLACDADADEWLATGVPPERVIAFLRAGVRHDEIQAFEGAGDVEGVLAMLAGLNH